MNISAQVATSEVQIPARVAATDIMFAATVGVEISLAEIPKDWGRITWDGRIITVS